MSPKNDSLKAPNDETKHPCPYTTGRTRGLMPLPVMAGIFDFSPELQEKLDQYNGCQDLAERLLRFEREQKEGNISEEYAASEK